MQTEKGQALAMALLLLWSVAAREVQEPSTRSYSASGIAIMETSGVDI